MRSLPFALAFAVGAAASVHAAEIVSPSHLTMTQTIVTLPAGVDTTLGVNTGRQYLCLMNTGAGLVTLGFDQPAIAGQGWAMEGATGAGHQGGSMCWESSAVAASTVHGISAAGSVVVVLEGE